MKDGRTEQATPKRQRDARRKGQVARSADLGQAVGLACAVFLLPLSFQRAGTALANDWHAAAATVADADPAKAAGLLATSCAHVALALVPMVLALAFGGIAAGVTMAGARPNVFHLKPKWSHLNPRQGIKRVVSKQAAWDLLKVTMKLVALAAVTYAVWQEGIRRLLTGPVSFERLLATVGASTQSLLVRAALLALLIGVVDAVRAKRKHTGQLRMTKHEVKEEHKQSEGNPHIKAAIRKKQLKMSRMRMIAEVARADVVLTNPTHLAVALAYEPGAAAPTVVAKGAGVVADRIRKEARIHGVPLQENKPLARALFRTAEVGDTIPVALYRAVAEVLAAVYRAKRLRAPSTAVAA